MSKKHIEISRRKLLAGLGTAGLASAGAGVGTTALFSDEESFEANSVMAGELDLKVDWEEHYSFPQLYDDFSDPTSGLDVTRSEPSDTSNYVGLPDPSNPVVWVHEDDLDTYMSNTSIEAFPDPDNDGSQEVEMGSFTYNPCQDGGDLPEDIENNLHSPNNTDNEGPVRTNNGDTSGGAPLVNLNDVKPGDFGEFTFSFHLCHNPGYVWLQANNVSESEGANPEPEQESDGAPDLAENIKTIWWYDARGDNVRDCSETIYLLDDDIRQDDPSQETPGELYSVTLDDDNNRANLTLEATLVDGNIEYERAFALAATPDGRTLHIIDRDTGRLGRYTGTNGFEDLGVLSVQGGGSYPGGVVQLAYSPSGTLYATSYVTEKLYTVDIGALEMIPVGSLGVRPAGADIAFTTDGNLYMWTNEGGNERGLYTLDTNTGTASAVGVTGQGPKMTGLAVLDSGSGDLIGAKTGYVNQPDPSNPDPGEFAVINRNDGTIDDTYTMHDQNGEHTYHAGDAAVGELCGEVIRQGNLKDDLDVLSDPNDPVPLDANRASEFTEFDGTDNSGDRECFPPGVTHYIGFGWWVPENVGNEIQGDSVSFDLGFYTQQCRNNDGSYKPS